jgi:hypothetical protein
MTKAEAASVYFNSLPREARAKLIPLLEEYRRMGMGEYQSHINLATKRMSERLRNMGKDLDRDEDDE